MTPTQTAERLLELDASGHQVYAEAFADHVDPMHFDVDGLWLLATQYLELKQAARDLTTTVNWEIKRGVKVTEHTTAALDLVEKLLEAK